MRIPSPTTREVVVTTPLIPGLELHIPPGTTITDEDGRFVRDVSITPIPVDRPPYPLPNGVQVSVYFTIQPGGAYVLVGGGRAGASNRRQSAGAGGYPRRGAWLVYPNYTNQPAGQRLPFWQYDPERYGWHVYGHGTVARDGRKVHPDPGVALYEFTGAMIGVERDPPAQGPKGTPDGDPVDLATGLFVMEKADLVLPDVTPLVLTRTYRTNDNAVRPFGIGTQHPYDVWFDNEQGFQEVDLILPDGQAIHYVRISPGTGINGAVYEHTATPTAFYRSRIRYAGSAWELALADGTRYIFPMDGLLESIQNRFGNTITLTRTGGTRGNIAKITAPHGRYRVHLRRERPDHRGQGAHRSHGRVRVRRRRPALEGDGRARRGHRVCILPCEWGPTPTRAPSPAALRAASLRRLGLAAGARRRPPDAHDERLRPRRASGASRAAASGGGAPRAQEKDARGITYLENEYDIAGRVIRQTNADTGEYAFDYTVNGSGEITQTDVTNPRGFVRRVVFNSAGYPTSDTQALGEAEEQTTSYTRLSGSHLVETTTDELGRITRFAYDSRGNVISVTRLDGTADAVTSSFTWHPTQALVTSVTDPLNHTTSYAYDGGGRLLSVTDPLNHQTTFVPHEGESPAAVTNPLNQTTQYGYDLGDLASVTTPLGHTETRFVDLGRAARAGHRSARRDDAVRVQRDQPDHEGGGRARWRDDFHFYCCSRGPTPARSRSAPARLARAAGARRERPPAHADRRRSKATTWTYDEQP